MGGASVKEEVERIVKGISEPHSDVLMNLQETADFLQVSKVTIHKWKKEKLIKSYRIGRKLYFKRNELSESMNNSVLQPKRV